jgi:farnesyl diphosphate synthase
MSFALKLQQNAADVEQALDVLLRADRLAGPGQPPDRLIAAMRHGALEGGKRLRPCLLREAGEMFGKSAESLLSAAVSVELIHCY